MLGAKNEKFTLEEVVHKQKNWVYYYFFGCFKFSRFIIEGHGEI